MTARPTKGTNTRGARATGSTTRRRWSPAPQRTEVVHPSAAASHRDGEGERGGGQGACGDGPVPPVAEEPRDEAGEERNGDEGQQHRFIRAAT